MNWLRIERAAALCCISTAIRCQPSTDSERRHLPNAVDASRGAPSASISTSVDGAADAQLVPNSEERLAKCLQTIDKNHDEIHAEMTPSVRCLIEIGRPAIPPLIDLLDAPDVGTRLHAVTALRAITRRDFGFDGTRWPGDMETRWLEWWAAVGYDFRAPPPVRAVSIEKIRKRYPSQAPP